MASSPLTTWQRCFVFLKAVEMGEIVRGQVLTGSEASFEPLEGEFSAGCRDIEFRAVAGGNNHPFGNIGQDGQFAGGFAELRRAHGEALAHLDGGGPMIQSQADQFHSDESKYQQRHDE
jgi:hypothetical protein